MPSAALAGCPLFRDPERIFPDLSAVRAADGLPFSEVFEARMVTRYDDIVDALHDPETFSSEPTVGTVPPPWRQRFEGLVPDRGTLIGVDNPDHDRLRSAVNSFFVPRRLARFEAWIRERAHRLVDTFVEDGRTDLKTSFALPLPLEVVSHLVGLDATRAEWIGAALGFFLGPRDTAGYGVAIDSVQQKGADLIVGYRESVPGPAQAVAQMRTSPYAIRLLPSAAGTPKFVRGK